MEVGECSRMVGENGLWAKLVPTDSQYSDIGITSGGTVIHSEVACSSYEMRNWCMIVKVSDPGKAEIRNTNQEAIIVDDVLIGKGETAIIECGSEIVSGPCRRGHLVFHFRYTESQKLGTKSSVISFDVEHAKCSICLNIWHDVVTVAPCLHNFCNGCFSEWLGRSQKKPKGVLCPQCRGTLQSVAKNHFLRNIEEGILQTFPSLRRSKDELALLDNRASVQINLVLTSKKLQSRKRPHECLSEESFSHSLLCPQCGSSIRGFRCNQSTNHLQCQACQGMMPSRPDVGVPQQCLGCDKAFCGAYWQSQRLHTGGEQGICSPETFQPVSHWMISRVPDTTHESNRYEQEITAQCIRRMGKTLQTTVSEWIVKLDNREIDLERLQLKNSESICSRTNLCSDCYEKLVDFILYWFRITIPHQFLPPDASSREDCWYGFACRTQHRNPDHAKKRNHVCRPTR